MEEAYRLIIFRLRGGVSASLIVSILYAPHLLFYMGVVNIAVLNQLRLGNIVEGAHPIHIHGHQFYVTAADGNIIPLNNRLLKSTIHVTSGETWDIEFKAYNPGIWPFHCHIPHHMSNNLIKPTGGMLLPLYMKVNHLLQ